MNLKLGCLCDFATADAGGKPIAVGIFDIFFSNLADHCPTQPFTLLLMLEASVIEGPEHQICARLLDPDGKELGAATFSGVKFGPTRVVGRPALGIVHYRQGPMALPYGDYSWEICRVGPEGQTERIGEIPFACVRMGDGGGAPERSPTPPNVGYVPV